jgi:hypothetical protein
MVADKVQARSFGAHDQLTRQPTEGRAKGGGLRIGEMERDVLISHGASAFINESMSKKSDGHVWSVCRHCGTAAGAPRAGGQRAPTTDPSARACRYCGDSDVVTVSTPYAFKLLAQECEAMGIQVRMGPDALVADDGDSDGDGGTDGDAEGAMDGGECDALSWLSPMQQRITGDKTSGCDEDDEEGEEGGEPEDEYDEDKDDGDGYDDDDDENAEEKESGDDLSEEPTPPAAAADEAAETLGEDEEDSGTSGGGAGGLRAPSAITLKDVDLAMSVPGGSGPSDQTSSLLGDLATLGAMGPSAEDGGAAAAESESAAGQIKTIVLKKSRRSEDAPAAPSARDADGDDDGDYDGDGGGDDDDFFA